MAEYTTNYNLYKPNREDSEQVDTTLYTNFEIIDAEVKKRETDISNLAEELNTKTDSIQSQVNTMAVESGIDPETKQARTKEDGTTFPTLRDRLNFTDEQIEDNAYFHSVTSTKYRDTQSNTDYYLTRISSVDEEGNLIKLKRGFSDDDRNGGTGETARSFANRYHASLTLNASLFDMNTLKLTGLDIYNGSIVNEGVAQTGYILGIKEDNTLVSYVPATDAQTIMNEGCLNALTGFIPLIDGGVKVDQSIIDGYSGATTQHPRQVIAQYPNKDIVILTCEGRTMDNPGMTCDDIIRILLAEGVFFAFLLDGGGSSQTVVKGAMVNKPIDNNGRTERKVPDFLYFAKGTDVLNRDKDIIFLNKDLGDLTKTVSDIGARLLGFSDTSITPSNLNDIKKNGFYWATATMENAPSTANSWGVIHFQVGESDSLQVAFPYNQTSGTIKMRRTVSGTYSAWRDL